MKFFSALFAFLSVLAGSLPASDFPTIKAPIPDVSVSVNGTIPGIDLRNYFEVTSIQGQVVQFATVSGTFNVEMLAASAPKTVANFLSYVNANRFVNTLVHRSDKPLGVIQGGGYIPNSTGTEFTSYTRVSANNPIPLETADPLLNIRGSLAMARVGSSGTLTVTNSSTTSKIVTVNAATLPAGFGIAWELLGSSVQSVSGSTVTLVGNANQTITSATTVSWENRTGTSEWFINTVDNSVNLPPASSGGYAAYGRVTGTGMTVVDAIAALPVLDGNVTVTSSSTSSPLVTVDAATLPGSFGPGWGLLGRTVQSVNGSSVTLDGNAGQTISTSTIVASSRFGSPFSQLPVLQNLPADGSVLLNNLVTMNSIKAVPVFPTAAGQPSVVTFSIVSNSNPSLVTPAIKGSILELTLNNQIGTADLVIRARDTNGNRVQSQLRVNVTAAEKKALGTWAEQTMLRTIATQAGSAVDIGAFTFAGSTGNLEVSVRATGPSWSVAKLYVIPVTYNLSGISPADTWLKVLPTYDTGRYGASGHDFDLDAKVTGGTASLRLRTVAYGSGTPTATIAVKSTGLQTFVNSTATAAVATPAQTIAGNAVDQLVGKAGIGVAPSGNSVVDVNGGDTRGLHLHPRSVPGKPTTGTWSKGTIILDSTWNLYICKAGGTPGMWAKVGN